MPVHRRKGASSSAASCRAGGQYFETSFQGIIGFDQLKLGSASAKKVGKQPLELYIDHFESGEQSLPALAVEALNGLAQLLDCLDNVFAFTDDRFKPR